MNTNRILFDMMKETTRLMFFGGLGLMCPYTGANVDIPSTPNEKPGNAGDSRFITRTYTNHAGTRDYKLYIPSGYHGQTLPLIVMLHGCKQDPDDFAFGTRMNALAEERQCLVAYPAQTRAANGLKCWNWFNAEDQQRDHGEPSIIAGITRELIADYHADPRRIYIAGLSSGAAMAVILGATYPDLYAAIGVHSGLPYRGAHDLDSALAAMRNGARRSGARHGETLDERRKNCPDPITVHPRSVPAIIFHGDQDTVVHPDNGDQVMAQRGSSPALAPLKDLDDLMVEQGQVLDGHAFTRTVRYDNGGQALAEQWMVHGAAHAWSGGSSNGSYTDPKGPDATTEMLRFFDTKTQ
ncbi:MAG: PHB depolymerase family esterase [Pseudomonadota bacterium]